MNTDAVTDAERLAVAQSVSGRADATNYAFWTDPATRMFIDALCLARRQVAALTARVGLLQNVMSGVTHAEFCDCAVCTGAFL